MDSLCAEQERCWSAWSAPASRATSVRSWPKSTISPTGTRTRSKGNLAPQLKIENEKEKPITINYDELVKSWQK